VTPGFAQRGVYMFVYFAFIFSYQICVHCVVLLWHGGVDLVGLKPNPRDPIFRQCFDTDGSVIWPVKPVPDMTYNVHGGTLNVTNFYFNIYDNIFTKI